MYICFYQQSISVREGNEGGSCLRENEEKGSSMSWNDSSFLSSAVLMTNIWFLLFVLYSTFSLSLGSILLGRTSSPIMLKVLFCCTDLEEQNPGICLQFLTRIVRGKRKPWRTLYQMRPSQRMIFLAVSWEMPILSCWVRRMVLK